MATMFLSSGQTQLLNLTLAWVNLRSSEIHSDPFAPEGAQRGASSAPPPCLLKGPFVIWIASDKGKRIS